MQGGRWEGWGGIFPKILLSRFSVHTSKLGLDILLLTWGIHEQLKHTQALEKLMAHDNYENKIIIALPLLMPLPQTVLGCTSCWTNHQSHVEPSRIIAVSLSAHWFINVS